MNFKMTDKDYEFFEFTDLTEEQIRYWINIWYDDTDFWNLISAFQSLSEDFIREFKDNINWKNISSCQELSEGFITEFADYIDWDVLCMYTRLRDEFIDQHNKRIYWSHLIRHQPLSEYILDKYIDRMKMEEIFEYQQVSEEWIKKHKDYWCHSSICMNKMRSHQKLSFKFKREVLRIQQKCINEWVNLENKKREEEKNGKV